MDTLMCGSVYIYTSVVQTAHSAPVKREAGGTEMLRGWPAVTHNCDLFFLFFNTGDFSHNFGFCIEFELCFAGILAS